jgi:dihydropteroate synthase
VNFSVLQFPVVMGILNITPDSFSDGGELFQAKQNNIDLAVQRALQMEQEGAQILDIGGESTRPGAQPISEQEELDRVIPVIKAIARETDICLSIDTSKAIVMQEAIKAGARFVNDVCALQKENSLQVIANAVRDGYALQVCLMHMQNNPQTMQQHPEYGNVVKEVIDFLDARIRICEQAGIPARHLVVDPGFGFGKTLPHNLQLVRELDKLHRLGRPVLVGLSRKSMIGTLTGNPDPKQRLAGSLALAWACVQRGAKILRVHDVKETVDSLKIFQAIQGEQAP